MLRVQQLREFVNQVKKSIPSIKYTQLVITNDEFVKFLEERKSSDNILFFAVIPEHGVIGQEDRSKYENYLQFFFIEKQAEKNLKHDEKLDLYNRVQHTVQSFVNLIIEAKSGESHCFDSCNMFEGLIEESIEIKMFWDGVQCRGYEIVFNLNTYFNECASRKE